MGIELNLFASLSLLAVLIAAAFFVFARVRSDYKVHGRLSRPVAILQVGFFCVYALSSYAFLDARWSYVTAIGWVFILALILATAGLLIIVFSMPFLGRRSFGREVGSLRTNGLYRYSRNPQLAGGFFLMIGYAMLWPSWTGGLWAGMWLLITHLMVRCEETHLENVFGDKYRDYCARTPRYVGLLRK